MRKILTLIICVIPFNLLKIFLLKLLGHSISYKSKIGISLLFVNKIIMKEGSEISHFNFIKLEKLVLNEFSFIKKINYFKGPFTIELGEKSGISNSNKIRRAYSPITYGEAVLRLGVNSFIVSNHFLDITKSIIIGDNSIVAGINSQFWTHGYYHEETGSDRIRIDGDINIGDNVYIGSSCILNPGITVGNAIHIGSGSIISKNLIKPGMYVSQALRFIENNLNTTKSKLKKVNSPECLEKIYVKE